MPDEARAVCGCEWGLTGFEWLPPADVVIVVDVLSFSTCVDVAVGRRVAILPYRWRDGSAEPFAVSIDVEYAAQADSSEHVPRLVGNTFVDISAE